MPPEEQTARPAGGVSSPGSWAGASSAFVGNAGPAFDPERAAEHPAPTPLLQPVDVAWEPGRIKTILRAQGNLTHDAVGVGVEDWLWREGELESLAEPLANTLNKVPVTRAAAAVSDELTVGAVLFTYAGRSIRERSRVLRAQKESGPPPAPEPITGVNAEGERVGFGGTVPDHWEMP